MTSLYRPLNNALDEIRVLRILPAPFIHPDSLDDHPLHFELEHVSLAQNPRYHALSYTWQSDSEAELGFAGHPGVGVDITIDEHKMKIPPNLAASLATLRNWSTLTSLKEELLENPFPPNMRIWVDALCINQSDNDERSSQVQKMHRIYQTAKGVNSWLGSETSDSIFAFDLINNSDRPLAKQYDDLQQRIADDRDWVLRQITNPSKEAQWIALAALLDRRYWRRIWIVQEILSNQNNFVHCGGRVARLDTFIQTAIEVVNYGQKNPVWSMNAMRAPSASEQALGRICVAPINFLIRERNRFADSHHRWPSMLGPLLMFQSHESTDYRDKVYGLLSLVEEDRGRKFVVDYSLSAHEVFKNVARHIIEGVETLSLIEHACEGRCGCHPREHVALGLPSWVPNWTCCRRGGGLIRFEQHFNAGLTATTRVKVSPDGNAMTASGLLVGTVEHVYHIPYGVPEEMKDAQKIKRALKSILLYVHSALGASRPDGSIDIPAVSATAYERLITTRGFPHLLDSLPLDQFARLCSAALDDRAGDDSFDDETVQLIFQAAFAARSLFTSRSAHSTAQLGVCYPSGRVGDYIAVLSGYHYPLLLRERTRWPRTYVLVGEVYLHGYMHGEAFGVFPEAEFEIY